MVLLAIFQAGSLVEKHFTSIANDLFAATEKVE